MENDAVDNTPRWLSLLVWAQVFLVILLIGVWAFVAFQLQPLIETKRDLEKQIVEKQSRIEELDRQLKQREAAITALSRDIESLRNTQENLLDFLAYVTDEKQVSILGRDVDWESVKADIARLPSGKRKQAILTAILLAWKEIPFALGKKSMSAGFDSPEFIRYVLEKVGLRIEEVPGARLSDTLMKRFKRVDKPGSGDLVFYKGQVGSFGFIYVSDGGIAKTGVGIGTLETIAPLQIINLKNINTPHFPLIGYFHVVYPNETE